MQLSPVFFGAGRSFLFATEHPFHFFRALAQDGSYLWYRFIYLKRL